MHKYTSRGERGRRREGGQSAQEEDKLAFYIRGHPGFIRSRDSTASERYVTSMWNVESVSPDLRASRRDTHLAKEATARAFVKRGPSRGREREREREREAETVKREWSEHPIEDDGEDGIRSWSDVSKVAKIAAIFSKRLPWHNSLPLLNLGGRVESEIA